MAAQRSNSHHPVARISDLAAYPNPNPAPMHGKRQGYAEWYEGAPCTGKKHRNFFPVREIEEHSQVIGLYGNYDMGSSAGVLASPRGRTAITGAEYVPATWTGPYTPYSSRNSREVRSHVMPGPAPAGAHTHSPIRSPIVPDAASPAAPDPGSVRQERSLYQSEFRDPRETQQFVSDAPAFPMPFLPDASPEPSAPPMPPPHVPQPDPYLDALEARVAQAIFDPSKNVHGAGLANISRQLSTYDVDGRGSLNPAGFSRFIRRLRLYPAPANSDIAALFSRYDPHGLGLVSIDQFKESMIRQARTPTARPTDFDLNKLQRKLAIAVGRHDWPPGVEVALRRAFASGRYGCMGSDVIEDSKLMFLLKEEFGVGSMLGNHELSALIASYPHPHGAVEIEWFIDNLLAQRHVMRKDFAAAELTPQVPAAAAHYAGQEPINDAVEIRESSHAPSHVPAPELVDARVDVSAIHQKMGDLMLRDRVDHSYIQTILYRLQLHLEYADKNRSGALTYEQFAKACRTFNPPLYLTAAETEALFASYSRGAGVAPIDVILSDVRQALHHRDAPFDVTPANVRQAVARDLQNFDRQGGTAVGVGRVFKKYDERRTGHLTRQGLWYALTECRVSMTKKEFDVLFASFDHRGSGLISIEEFANCMIRHEYRQPQDVQQIHARVAGELPTSRYAVARHYFKLMDSDADGRVTKRQFTKALQQCNIRCLPHELSALFDYLDPQHTGTVPVEGFFDSLYA